MATVRKMAFLLLIVLSITAITASAQSERGRIEPILAEEILPPDASLLQIRQYILDRVAPPPVPTDPEKWRAEAQKLRRHLLADIVFHGWPKEWISAPPRFEDLGTIETGKGYRIRKLRYEIVPQFYSTALLYEPQVFKMGIPAILNVNGHVGAPGKAVEYKQKRCINFAKRGILALSLEWLACGEMAQKENQHWFGAHLDLVGTHELGLFYLAMRKGLDYLYAHPLVDRKRIGMTGLSGGGWQTITLSSLDERIQVAVPVAGFSSVATRVEARRYGDLGDIEQSAADMFAEIDFTHLVGLMAPRPTFLIYNAEDDCCFRGPLVRHLVFDSLQPLFRLLGAEGAFGWHENQDPATHNYQKDNRIQAYGFFARHFGLPAVDGELDSDDEVKPYEELAVGLPKDNLTILGLARRLALDISRAPIPPAGEHASWAAGERAKLRDLIRYKPVGLKRTWVVANTKNKGVETTSYLYQFGNGLFANGVRVRAIGRPDNSPVTLILNDKGKKASAAQIADRVNRGEQVLALDLLFTGDSWRDIAAYSYAQILHGLGDRPLGLQAAQLIAIAGRMREGARVKSMRLEVSGLRNQVASYVVAALEPGLIYEMVTRDGITSLSYLLDKPVEFSEAPELFCLDLYRHFDLDRLQILAGDTLFKREGALP